MKKALKWSVLATIVLAIIYYFVTKQVDPLTLKFFGYFEISACQNASSFVNLIFVIPAILLLVFIAKRDEDMENGVAVVSIASIMASLAFADPFTEKWAIIGYAIIALFVFVISLAECNGHKSLIQRIIFSTILVFLVNMIILGFWNGLLIATLIFTLLLAYYIGATVVGYGFVFCKKLPKFIKAFVAWMNE